MKRIPLFEEFINKNQDYSFKDDSGDGKPTMVLKIGPDSWKKIKNLFDDKGRPQSDEIKRIPYQGYIWDLYAQSYISGGKEYHKIYGVSGDYTFGNAPTYYQQKHRGNKKAAKKILSDFIEKYL